MTLRLLVTSLLLLAITLVAIPALSSTLPTAYPVCRQGYTTSYHPLDQYGATLLNRIASGSTYDYDAGTILPANPTGQVYYRMIWIQGSGPTGTTFSYENSPAHYQAMAQATPGALWLLSNEPENPFQANTNPETYAHAYHDARAMIKGYDNTAKFAIGGITQATPLRLEWLNRFLVEYNRLYGPLPIDYWNIHGYQFREVQGEWGAGIPVGLTNLTGVVYTWADTIDVTKFRANVIAFRQWMKAKGFQNKPLLITEYGAGGPNSYPGGWTAINNYTLTQTMGFMTTYQDQAIGYPQDSYHLVQRFNLFSLDGWPPFEDSFLVYTATMQLTPLGLAWEKYVRTVGSGLAPCSPGLENAVKQVLLPFERMEAYP